jgi:hypothetical protein
MHGQQKAKRTDRLAERILSEMRRRQAGARTELPFSIERLTKLFGRSRPGYSGR